jgi:hypothetical protein
MSILIALVSLVVISIVFFSIVFTMFPPAIIVAALMDKSPTVNLTVNQWIVIDLIIGLILLCLLT